MRSIIIFLFLVNAFASLAQPIKRKEDWGPDISDNCYMQNRWYVGLTFGLPNQLKKYWREYEKFGDYKTTNIGPAQLQLEYAIAKKMSVHAFVGYMTGESGWSVSKADSNGQVITTNSGFYYQTVNFGGGLQPRIFYNKKMDLFLKGQVASLNFYFEHYFDQATGNWRELVVPNTKPTWQYYAGLGVRYFFTKKMAMQGEAGLGNVQILNIGLVKRFGL